MKYGHDEGMKMTLTMTTTTSKILHTIEDATWGERHDGLTVKELAGITSLGRTTVTKTVNDLKTGGFIKAGPQGTSQGIRWIAVRKTDDDTREEVKNGMTDTQEKKTSPGRPRPTETIERDEKALAAIKGSAEGLTIAELAQELGIEQGKAYLAVWRLRRDDKVVKAASGTRTPRWKATG